MGQTRVDLLHLLEDLRDAYPGGLEETIVAETVANSLDSGARLIAFAADPAARTLTIVDDGQGMTRAQLRRYHDLAASTKKRGRGIGFAGVGIKLALLACDDVVTETRRAGRAHATRWHLASRQKAPWEYLKPVPGLVPFIRTGARGALYLAYRKALQEAVSAHLSAWGEEAPSGRPRQPRTRRMERDLEHVLLDLADDYPLLGALVERRAGGQRRIPAGRPADGAAGAAWAVADARAEGIPGGLDDAAPHVPGDGHPEEGAEGPVGPGGTSSPGEPESGAPRATDGGGAPGESGGAGARPAGLPGRAAGRKRGRYALAVAFEKRGEETGMARLVETTVLVNEDHPAWRRAEASRAEGYHVALCVAMALAPLTVEAAAAHEFIATFMGRWGEAGERSGKRRGRGDRRSRGKPS